MKTSVRYSDVVREFKTAGSYLWRGVRAVNRLVAQDEGRDFDHSWLVANDFSLYVINPVFEAAVHLLDRMDDDQIADLEQDVKELATTVRRVRLARTLANVDGRTPEEAASFIAKSKEFRT